ncbi:unnamed protein product [Echinostoma caproni]|uniref:HAP1 N-terminal domain-containing protein n=1 Tax=Echinostoma caproni TaxID=27848 RepID=A0A183AJY4_9TREM|nr:unnamed protein product [Echinostoma caproni]
MLLPLQIEGHRGLLARRFSPFRLPRFSEHRDQCCGHLKEIDDLRLLVMKLNHRIYLAETGVRADSNENFAIPPTTPDWIKDPGETCVLLDKYEKKLDEQTMLLNEYESTIRVMREKLESVTKEKNRLSVELTRLRYVQQDSKIAEEIPHFGHYSTLDLGNSKAEQLMRENNKLAEYISSKHEHDERMYHLMEEQLHHMMQQVDQIAKQSAVARWRSQSSLGEHPNAPFYARDQRRKHSLGQLIPNGQESRGSVTESNLSEMVNKLE